jgi:hypothetical protein
MRIPTVLLCLVIGLAAALAGLVTSCDRPPVRASVPSVSAPRTSATVKRLSDPQHGPAAGRMDPDLRVGAIFLDGAAMHVCTGSVVHSAGGNLVMTAAHCLAGASRIAFAPGFAGDAAPADLWTADNVYLDPRWIATRDPRADYAVVRVISERDGPVESHIGLALSLGTAPPPGSHVTVMGYPSGVGGSPIGCQATTGVTEAGFPSLACEGLVGGTSGAPWVSGTTITGLIGGLDGGGCAENVSYSAPFDGQTAQLLARADAGGPGDVVPNDATDNC